MVLNLKKRQGEIHSRSTGLDLSRLSYSFLSYNNTDAMLLFKVLECSGVKRIFVKKLFKSNDPSRPAS
jgi:hypothetical protein